MTQSNKTRKERIAEIREYLKAGCRAIPADGLWLLDEIDKTKDDFDEDGNGPLAQWKRQYLVEWGKRKSIEKELDKAKAEISKSSEALRVLQELTGSDNQVNPWLGVAASTALLKNDSENLAKERAVSAEFEKALEILAGQDKEPKKESARISMAALETVRRLRASNK